MAHFYGTVQGARGEASRLGSPSSGIDARATGWDVGVRVSMDRVGGEDTVRVFRTDGSNGCRSVLIAEFTAATPEGEEAVVGKKAKAKKAKASPVVAGGAVPRFSGLEFEGGEENS